MGATQRACVCVCHLCVLRVCELLCGMAGMSHDVIVASLVLLHVMLSSRLLSSTRPLVTLTRSYHTVIPTHTSTHPHIIRSATSHAVYTYVHGQPRMSDEYAPQGNTRISWVAQLRMCMCMCMCMCHGVHGCDMARGDEWEAHVIVYACYTLACTCM